MRAMEDSKAAKSRMMSSRKRLSVARNCSFWSGESALSSEGGGRARNELIGVVGARRRFESRLKGRSSIPSSRVAWSLSATNAVRNCLSF